MQNVIPIPNIYSGILFKELDTIHDTIKNLDDIIYKSKNFAFLTWGGSIFLIAEKINFSGQTDKAYLLLLTAVIPLLFWTMDFKWRKYILQCSKREKIISLFINSDEFKKLVSGEADENSNSQFPFYDPVGWIYTKKGLIEDAAVPKNKFDAKYIIDENEFTFKKVLFYKEAYLFYGVMVLLSVILGIVMLYYKTT